ncbi:hypothetical protein HD806DRAFT_538330 [Xylariaceae sp. AK1471]|nr:hypothetical protein HD806DRAFT_538330 [Xylariaceae sp. AK1471]
MYTVNHYIDSDACGFFYHGEWLCIIWELGQRDLFLKFVDCKVFHIHVDPDTNRRVMIHDHILFTRVPEIENIIAFIFPQRSSLVEVLQLIREDVAGNIGNGTDHWEATQKQLNNAGLPALCEEKSYSETFDGMVWHLYYYIGFYRDTLRIYDICDESCTYHSQ